MKVTKKNSGTYNVNVHGYNFTLERLYGSKNWTLYNCMGVEVNTTETKAGMLEVMSYWSAPYTVTQASASNCSYA